MLACMSICAHVCSAQAGQQRVSHTRELELQVVVRHRGVADQRQILSLQPLIL